MCDAPLVSDHIVRVTLMNYEGDQHVISGRVGQTLMSACEENGNKWLIDDSNGGGGVYSVYRNPIFTEELFGEGCVSPLAHVVVANEWVSKLQAPSEREEHVLKLVPAQDITPNSRLATEIVLSKDLDGLAVAVPEPPPGEYDHEE